MHNRANDLPLFLESGFDLDGRLVHIRRDLYGTAGLARAVAAVWDLLILDVMLPGKDGLGLCRMIATGPSRKEWYSGTWILKQAGVPQRECITSTRARTLSGCLF